MMCSRAATTSSSLAGVIFHNAAGKPPCNLMGLPIARHFSMAVEPPTSPPNIATAVDDGGMNAWLTKTYSTPLVQERVAKPRLWRDDQVLIKVQASSINPIDVRMTEGYGNEILSNWRRLEASGWNPLNVLSSVLRPSGGAADISRLPLVTGRDCCGEVVEVGARVSNVRIGDSVIAVVPGHWPGAHAEFVVTPSYALAPKPAAISPVDACALAYTACTSWVALVTIARVSPYNASNVRVLIHGGSGGMGTTAIQFLRAWGAPKIVATCSAKNMDLVKSLGAIPIDYNSPAAKQQIIEAGPFEVILDCARSDLADWSDNIMGIWRNCVHVSVVSPLLADTDRYGLPAGLFSTFVKYAARSIQPATQGRWFSYAFFMPNSDCLAQLSQFLAEKKVVPIVEKVYGFGELPDAYAKVGQLHGRGKSVIDFSIK